MPTPVTGTRDKILQTATRVFAEKGFKAATVRRICALAGANLAAVNYHFGSKERLYLAVLEEFLRVGDRRFPYDAGLTPDAGPEERLRAYVRSTLLRLLGDGDPLYEKLGKLFVQELLDPLPQFDLLAERHILPIHDHLLGILRALLPPDTEDVAVHRCAGSINGQCLLFTSARAVIQLTCPIIGLTAENLEQVADFITAFSLNGLRGIARTGRRPVPPRA